MRLSEITKENNFTAVLEGIIFDFSGTFNNLEKSYKYYSNNKDIVSLYLLLDNGIKLAIDDISIFLNDKIENLDQTDPDIPKIKNQAQVILNKLQNMQKEINMLHK